MVKSILNGDCFYTGVWNIVYPLLQIALSCTVMEVRDFSWRKSLLSLGINPVNVKLATVAAGFVRANIMVVAYELAIRLSVLWVIFYQYERVNEAKMHTVQDVDCVGSLPLPPATKIWSSFRPPRSLRAWRLSGPPLALCGTATTPPRRSSSCHSWLSGCGMPTLFSLFDCYCLKS